VKWYKDDDDDGNSDDDYDDGTSDDDDDDIDDCTHINSIIQSMNNLSLHVPMHRLI